MAVSPSIGDDHTLKGVVRKVAECSLNDGGL
jgi:hypothetical protein